MPPVTANATSTSRLCCSTSAGIAKAAARVTTPRMPAQPTIAASRQVDSPSGWRVGSMASSARTGKTHTRRSSTTARNVARQIHATRPGPSPLSAASVRIRLACSPISKKTAFSSRKEMVRQFSRSAIRDEAVCSTGARCPSSRPATTTARTPEPCSSSATT